MNYFGVFFIITLAVLIELSFFKIRKTEKAKQANIDQIENQLEIIEAFSYLPSSKTDTLTGNLNEFARNFFHQDQFTAMKVIFIDGYFQKHAKLLDFHPKSEVLSKKYLDQFEKYLLSQALSQKNFTKDQAYFFPINKQTLPPNLINQTSWQTAVIHQLVYQTKRIGFVIFLSNEQVILKPEDYDFFVTTGNIITLLLRKVQVNVHLTQLDQLRAINVEW